MPADDDLVHALRGVANAFSALAVPFFVGGSVASSYHGAMRSTMDVDVVAELAMQHIDGLMLEVADTYYANRLAIESSIQSASCFNLIHLATSFKVDVFVSQRRSFDQAAMQRARPAERDRRTSVHRRCPNKVEHLGRRACAGPRSVHATMNPCPPNSRCDFGRP